MSRAKLRLEGAIRGAFRRAGLELHRYVAPEQLTAASLRHFGIDLVFDIGANAGQFATELRRAGYRGRIVSFEPLSQAHEALLRASAGDAAWQVHSRCAIGNRAGEVEINIAGNSESSSILPMLQTHLDASAASAYEGRESVPLLTLDMLAASYLERSRAAFLKIDTQGFEWHVLDGASQTMPGIQGVQVELSLVPLYAGQHLWDAVIERLEAAGFTLWALKPVFSDRTSGRTLQLDGVFFRALRPAAH